MLDPSQDPASIGDSEKMRSLSDDYVIINQRDAIASSLNHDSESAIDNKKPASYKSLPMSHRYTPTSELLLKPTASTKENDTRISTDDSVFNLLEQIEDQITDFQADFAKLKRAYRGPPCSILQPNHSPGYRDTPKSMITVRRSGSAFLSRLEAEILDLRDYLERKAYQKFHTGRLNRHQEGNTVPEVDTQSVNTDVISHTSITRINQSKPELISVAEVCELLLGIVGFLYIAVPLLYGLAKVSLFVFILLSPFHKFS